MRLEGDAGATTAAPPDAGATIAAALDAGVTLFDTARAYGGSPGENERLVAAALRGHGGARIITKGGMTRPGGGWVPDGRAKTIEADCEASLAALAGLPIDLYLLHAPDPRTPWRTSVRALGRLGDRVTRVGVANVTRAQLDEACAIAPIAAVEVALSWLDDTAIRGGVVERCEELGIAVIAHSPLGGPRRAARLERDQALAAVAAARGVSAAEVALAWLLGRSAAIVAIPGARQPQTVRSAVRAGAMTLTAAEREALGGRRRAPAPRAPARTGSARTGSARTGSARTGSARTGSARTGPARTRPARPDSEVVLVMGIPGAGKSRVAAAYSERGYVRFNRDERGGTLADMARALDAALGGGEIGRAVLDNTYLSRASRSYVVEVASDHGVPVRCVWLDTPLDQAQVNLVARLLARFGSLPAPDQLRAAARSEPGLMLPTSQMRAVRELEPPADGEGFAAIERIEFGREPPAGERAGGLLIAAGALAEPCVALDHDPGRPVLIFDWRPGGTADELTGLTARVADRTGALVETAVCAHGGGPPACWCRPPLPGLPMAFAHAHRLDLRRCTVVGTSAAHRTLARVLGCRFLAPG